MMKVDNSEEVEINLDDSSNSGESDDVEEPQTLWRAPPAPEEEENIHTSTFVEISDTKPLLNVRDPRGINDNLKVHNLTPYDTLMFAVRPEWLVALSWEEEEAPVFSLCLQVMFEDVIAEPVSVHSADRVWIWSHALFEVSRVWIYRIVTVLLAIPMSVISGLLFATLGCIHIW